MKGEREEEEKTLIDLQEGSQVLYIPKFLPSKESWDLLKYLDEHIPWFRPTIRVYGREVIQPRDTCYIASEGLPKLRYSGYQPPVYSWDEPTLKLLLDQVHEALPGSSFNSLLLNRYKDGSDYVSWHSDEEKLYGPTPEIASVSFGREREFLLKRKQKGKRSSEGKFKEKDEHCFMLKHGSLLVMRGNLQRDWLHSVPKRPSALGVRINLTFRHVRATAA